MCLRSMKLLRLHAGQQRKPGHQEGCGLPALVQQAVERCALCADEPWGGLSAIRQSTLPSWFALCMPVDPEPPERCHRGHCDSIHNVCLLSCNTGEHTILSYH